MLTEDTKDLCMYRVSETRFSWDRRFVANSTTIALRPSALPAFQLDGVVVSRDHRIILSQDNVYVFVQSKNASCFLQIVHPIDSIGRCHSGGATRCGSVNNAFGEDAAVAALVFSVIRQLRRIVA